jgi:hypothetical protein
LLKKRADNSIFYEFRGVFIMHKKGNCEK